MSSKVFGLILIVFVGSKITYADEAPRKMYEVFFGCNLIVETKITNHSDHDYTMQILDIYRDYQIGIDVGDFIKFKKEFNVTSSVEEVSSDMIAKRSNGVAFLSKYESGWSVSEYYIIKPKSDTVNLYLAGCKISDTRAGIKEQIKAYFEEFELDSEGKLLGKVEAKKLNAKKLCSLVLLQYVRHHLFDVPKPVFDKLDCYSFVEPEQD